MTLPISLISSAGLALIPIIAPAAEQPGVWALHEEHVLGAPARFLVTAAAETDAMAAILAARAEIERLDGVFNSRRDGAELFELNRARSGVVSSELFEVIALAEQVRARSGGAYNPLMGEALKLWRQARDTAPSNRALAAAAKAGRAPIALDAATRHVALPARASLALDSIAKGYIVDAALKAGLAAAPIAGFAVDIGGDLACAGCAPTGLFWEVDLPDPAQPLDRAPVVARAHLKGGAIATSGLGPRDFSIGGQTYSATLSPDTASPVRRNLAATVTAPTTAEADALATALLVMPASDGLALANAWPGAEARIAAADGAVHRTSGWAGIASEPAVSLESPICQAAAPKAAQPTNRWMADWAVQIVYSSPQRAVESRNSDFRTPYMAMWITDKDNNPIRTLVLVGTRDEWQKDNYIWWNMYRDKASNLVRLRSTATQLSGAYPTYWPGYNDDWKFVPQGDYILHVETSRERGQHTYRTMPLRLGNQPFTTALPPTPEGGGMRLVYAKRE